MPWYFWALVVYFAIDFGVIIAKWGDQIEINGPLVTGTLVVRILTVLALIAALHH